MPGKPPPCVLYTGIHEPYQVDSQNWNPSFGIFESIWTRNWVNQELIIHSQMKQSVNPCSYYRCNIWKLRFICKNINKMIQISYKQNKFKFHDELVKSFNAYEAPY